LKILPPKMSGIIDRRNMPQAVPLASHQCAALPSGSGISPPSKITCSGVAALAAR
jgi:hypothetical protein